jgi:hypothetical protein
MVDGGRVSERTTSPAVGRRTGYAFCLCAPNLDLFSLTLLVSKLLHVAHVHYSRHQPVFERGDGQLRKHVYEV